MNGREVTFWAGEYTSPFLTLHGGEGQSLVQSLPFFQLEVVLLLRKSTRGQPTSDFSTIVAIAPFRNVLIMPATLDRREV